MPQEIFHLTSAGSVDDGKSTILARLLLDTGSVFEDQLKGINPKSLDATVLADLLDGLESERDQGITIDVAHRFFDAGSRRYHIADSPGHEQYTRNMATAASHADAMLLVVDVRAGVKPQTVRHFHIARKLGIERFLVAVNKMDLVGYRQKAFTAVADELSRLVNDSVAAVVIPVSGLKGDNIVRASKRMPWWSGPTVVEALEGFALSGSVDEEAIFAIQYVQRVPGGGRRFLGSLLSGDLETGSLLTCPRYPGKALILSGLAHAGAHVTSVTAPAEVSLTLDHEVHLERGDVLSEQAMLEHTDQFEADVIWLDDNPGLPGRNYLLRLGHNSVKFTITRVFQLNNQ